MRVFIVTSKTILSANALIKTRMRKKYRDYHVVSSAQTQ